MRALVIGASGLVGSYLMRSLGDADVTGTCYRNQSAGFLRFDIADRSAVDQVIGTKPWDIVFLPAAFTNVDACEDNKAECLRVNVEGTRTVAEVCRSRNAYIVFFSTDFIFDGTAGPYAEDARPCPVSAYGASKMECEFLVSHLCPGSLIVRTTCVYGWEERARNFALRLIMRPPSAEPVRAPEDQVTTPTYAGDLADITVHLARLGRSGVYNVAGRTLMSRYEFARAVTKVFSLDPAGIAAVRTSELKSLAKRPLNGGLLVNKVESDLGITIPGVFQSLERMKDDKEKYSGIPETTDL